MNEQRTLERTEAREERRAVEAAPADRIEQARPSPLFQDQDLAGYRTRWSGIQTGFVDEPRKAVEEADALVSELMTRLTQGFADERRRLEERWGKAENVSTEDLRQAMHRYRSFFERLLTI